jgi:hypothetical protein
MYADDHGDWLPYGGTFFPHWYSRKFRDAITGTTACSAPRSIARRTRNGTVTISGIGRTG